MLPSGKVLLSSIVIAGFARGNTVIMIWFDWIKLTT